MNRDEILHAAVETFGRSNQMMMAVEEMSELIKAINKYFRVSEMKDRPKSIEDVREEIADCQVMLDQMKIMFGSVDTIERKKLERLEKRIAEYRMEGT